MRALLIRTVVLVAAVRVLLWFMPWPRVLRSLRALASSGLVLSRSRESSTERLARAVRVSSHLIPAATCLTQSLSLQCLLTAAGRPSRVEIGVMRNAPSSLQAHAWVEVDGRTLLSRASDTTQFLRILSLESALAANVSAPGAPGLPFC